MKQKYENLDSSSDEELKENYTPSQHLNFLLKNILNINYIGNSESLKLRLGLILHDLANRFFTYSIIKNTYKEIKSKILSLNNDSYKENLSTIKIAFNKHLNELFIIDNKENIADKDYKKLFNFLFNPDISIPEKLTLKDNITTEYVKKILLQELQNSNINLNILSKNPLNFTIHDSKEILAFSEIISRNNKNQLKYRILEETDNNLSTITNLLNTREKTFTTNHIMHHKTGNVQTDIIGFGTYDEILSKFNQDQKYIHAIIKRVFEIVQGKEATQSLEELPRKLNHFAEKLTHLLFVVEIHRNNTTLFTAPMFLELIDKNSVFLSDKKLFPMSAKNAVAQTRDILKNYKHILPNSRAIDYDITNVKNGNQLLIKEGNILIKWLSEKLNNFKLENLAQILDTMILIELYNSTDINNISIYNIKTFLEKVHQLEDCPTDSLKLLNVNLTALLPELNCTEERNLKLIKTQLLKKNFSQNLKDLIEITYFEFTKSLENIQKFWIQKQAILKDDIKEIYLKF